MSRAVTFLLFAVLALPGSLLAGSIVVSQADGSPLLLDEPAKKIVSLSPNLTELVYAAGAGDLLLATVEYSSYPKAAQSLPRVGDAFRIDIERIHQYAPDLVLAWPSGNPAAAVAQLADLGFRVWSIEIREPSEIPDTLEAISKVTRTDAGIALANELRARLAALQARYQAAEPITYFYQVAARPLYTVNGEHLISRGLRMCGGRNVFDGLQTLAPQVGVESVLEANPQLLIGPDIEGQENPLEHWRSWPRINAVSNDNFLLLDADSVSRATPRFVAAIEHACTMMEEMRNE